MADTDDFVFHSVTGRAMLPDSAFDEQKLLPNNISGC
jgi:hypothetical protein